MKKRLIAIIRKELIHIIRDPRSLGVAILMPVIMLTLFGYAITFDVKHFPIAFYDQDKSCGSRDFVKSFSNTEYIDIIRMADSPDEITKLLDGEIAKAAIVIPPKFSQKIKDKKLSPIQILINGSDGNTASVAIGYINTIIQSYSRKIHPKLTEPINAEIRVWYNPQLKSVIFIVPGLIVIILMLLSAVLTAMTIVGEKEKGTIEQLIASPIKPFELMAGKLIPYIGLAFFDIILVTGMGNLIFGVPIRGNVLLFFGIATIFIFCSLGIGLFVSTIARSQQEAMMMALIGTVLPSILLSGFIFPIASMPPVIAAITYLVPARYFLVIARSILLKGVGIQYFLREILMLLLFAVLIFAASAKRFKKTLD